jgi:hypothetical protein
MRTSHSNSSLPVTINPPSKVSESASYGLAFSETTIAVGLNME